MGHACEISGLPYGYEHVERPASRNLPELGIFRGKCYFLLLQDASLRIMRTFPSIYVGHMGAAGYALVAAAPCCPGPGVKPRVSARFESLDHSAPTSPPLCLGSLGSSGSFHPGALSCRKCLGYQPRYPRYHSYPCYFSLSGRVWRVIHRLALGQPPRRCYTCRSPGCRQKCTTRCGASPASAAANRV